MLQSLRVRNFAIVESLEVDFGPGLNVITGETGAGKSIVIGALGLLLGMRADRSQVRTGAEQCQIEASFFLTDTAAIGALLDELGITACEEGTLVLRRTVTAASGSGKCVVNDCTTTVQSLKRIGDLLVDLHGPHEHQSLLNQDFQLEILDAFGHLEAERTAHQKTYDAVLEIRRRRSALDGDDESVAQQIEMLAFQIKEIEAAELQGQSEESLAAEHALLANAQEILTLGQSATAALSEDDASAFQRVVEARRQLDAMARLTEEASPWQTEAEALASGIQALATSLQRRMESIELDPARLQWVEERIGILHRLKRKYGGTIAEILEFVTKARSRLQDLSSRTERLAAIDKEQKAAEKAMLATGETLTSRRQKAAQELGRAVTTNLRALGFPHGEFRIEITPAEPRPSGLDLVDFGFAPNVGEPMRPLRVIASSGEISRVMLATKAVLAKHDRVPVLVFDEVDANVGGEMGVAIGEKLQAIAKGHQVLCITHLPQVAAHGTTHFAVAKRVTKGRTFTEISPVVGTQREEEIARMLGGKNLTSVTLRHARELLARP
ncbi:MAG: DNA repair protein RecN [Verrucomicrobia bacterium]|nr:DNA repair protein RecN [Verrucomicrobiota bacterium]